MSAIDRTASPGEQILSTEPLSDDLEEKIVQEFAHLLEKSKQLFNGLRYNDRSASLQANLFPFSLRDLPQYGHKQWQPYFGRTFDIYTKLWKFQQQHR